MLKQAAIALLATSLLGGCGNEREQTGTEPGKAVKVYRHAMDGAPTNLDPTQSATVYASYLTRNVYDTLYSYKYLKRPYELKPNLAVAMPEVSADGLTYTIRIKKGVRYVDDPCFEGGKGRELVAGDFVYSIKRHFDPKNRSQGLWLWQGRIAGLDQWKADGADYSQTVEGLKALDDHTIQITLTRPYPQLTYTLAMGFSSIVSPEAVAEYGRELSVHPVGSGPFRMVRFDTSKAVLVPNPNFRAEPLDLAAEGYDPTLHGHLGLKALDGRSPPFVDRLEIDFISENAARWNSFTKGNEIQFTVVPVEQVDGVLASKQPVKLKKTWSDQYHWKSGTEAGLVYVPMNLHRPALGYSDDPGENARRKALRCAIIKSFDWEARNERFYSGIGTVYPGIIPPVTPEFDAEADRASVTRDVNGAKKLLARHGWTADTLPELRYGIVSSVIQRQFFEQMRGFLGDIGYPSEKIVLDSYATFGDFNKAVKTDQLDFFGIGWALDYPDAENTLQLLFGPNETPGSNNSNMKNARFDALYRQSSVMQPGAERTALYREMNRIAIEECASVMSLSRNRIYMWHKDVIGWPDREILGGFWLRYVDVRG